MNLLAELTPTSFQENVLAWLGVATVLVGAFSGFIALVLAKVAQIKADAAAKQGASDHATSTANIASLQTAVTNIALKTPLPESTEPAKVTIANTTSNPVPVDEQTKK